MVRSCALGGWVAMIGAKMAVRNTMPTITRPISASLLRRNRRRMLPNWVWRVMPPTAAAWLSAPPKPPAPASRVISPTAGA